MNRKSLFAEGQKNISVGLSGDGEKPNQNVKKIGSLGFSKLFFLDL